MWIDYARSMACFLLDSDFVDDERVEREDVVKNGRARVSRRNPREALPLSNFSTTTSLTDRPATFPIRGHKLPRVSARAAIPNRATLATTYIVYSHFAHYARTWSKSYKKTQLNSE